MGKLNAKQALEMVSSMAKAFKAADEIEVYECDKGDGNIVFVEKGEHLPPGWTMKRGPKGVFVYCPAHPQQQSSFPIGRKGDFHGDSE